MLNTVTVETDRVKFRTAPDLYGLFFEDINRAADGGLYPEMIRNRAFEDSLIPEGTVTDEKERIYVTEHGWPGAFNHGEGMDEWADSVEKTDVPGWYARQARMSIRRDNTLNANRKAALEVHFLADGMIWNVGYAGMHIGKGEKYHFYFMVRCGGACELEICLLDSGGKKAGTASIEVPASDAYQRLDCDLSAQLTDDHACLGIRSPGEASLVIGFTSLMPVKTFRGHGLREDLARMLKNTNARFIRFPGGCVVEGINAENALRFSDTIGPVWERPGKQLMWHYRTTNGLGFHEYLQLCEDLDMEAMYVCNCGMDCQARHGGGLSEKLTDDFLLEALHALEYALGSSSTEYGSMRAAAGHPEPFRLKYVEIGNENWGPEYLERYKKFYRVLKQTWPDVILLSNSHTERSGLPTEYADEHYYDKPEFFLENTDLFDGRDRKGPKIFLGEYAVNGGKTIASMECALAEAAFLTGVERNQDIVRLSAYAPLFQNADYTAWKPNLIVFNNHKVYGIPSYHVLSLFGRNRGKEVVECHVECDEVISAGCGISGIMCEKEGLMYRNVRINGKKAELNRMIFGRSLESREGFEMRGGGKEHKYTGKSREWNEAFEAFIKDSPFGAKEEIWGVFGQEDLEEYTFEAELKFSEDNPVTLSIWNFRPDTDAGCNEPKDPEWTVRSVRNRIWRLDNGMSSVRVPGPFEPELSDEECTPFIIDYSKFNRYRIEAHKRGYDCYINDMLIEHIIIPPHPLLFATASVDEEWIFVKLVSVAEEEKEVTVQIDCGTEPEAEMELITARPEEGNSFEEPEKVSAEKISIMGDGEKLCLRIPAHSVSVIKLKKAEGHYNGR